MAAKEKPQEPAGYCTTAVLANLFDITAQWVGELTKNGVIRKHDTEVGPRYNVVEATRAYVRYLREKAAGRDKDESVSEKEEERLEAEIRIKKAKAEYAELELAELQGQMHRSEDVAFMTEQLVFTIRSLIIALPGRLAVDVAAVDTAAETSAIIRKECNAVLDELASFKYDPVAYHKRVMERQKWSGEVDEEV